MSFAVGSGSAPAGAWARRLPSPNARSYPLWVAGTGVAGVAVAAGLPHHPQMTAGLVGGAIVFMALLLRPIVVLGVVLAFGAVNLSFLTGGQRLALGGMGGVDMNGIRLMGFVAGFTGLLVVDRRMLAAAMGPHGRYYLLFLGYAAATLAISPSPAEGLRLLLKMAFPFLVFVGVAGLVRDRVDLDRLGSWTLIAAAVLVMLINPAIVAVMGYDVGDDGAFHLGGLGLHHNMFAQYLLAMALLAVARYIVRGQYRYLILAVGLGLWAVLAFSRTMLGAAVAGLAAVAVYGAIVRRNYRPLVAATIVGAALAIPLTGPVLERTFGHVPSLAELADLGRDPAALFASMNWMGRETIWPVLYSGFQDSPVIGLGLGASAPLLRRSTFTDVAHNEYLRVAVDTGLVGLAILGLAVAVWFLACARAGGSRDPLAREYALAALAMIPATAVFAVTGDPFDYYSHYTQYLAFFVAAALGAAALGGEEGGAPTEQRDAPEAGDRGGGP